MSFAPKNMVTILRYFYDNYSAELSLVVPEVIKQIEQNKLSTKLACDAELEIIISELCSKLELAPKYSFISEISHYGFYANRASFPTAKQPHICVEKNPLYSINSH
ncbi:MAG: hypothetical protein JO131_07540 [Gammaproteobacteria bacterium]|nr:hypothetical protein [Gammaproteobacteria bacterium]